VIYSHTIYVSGHNNTDNTSKGLQLLPTMHETADSKWFKRQREGNKYHYLSQLQLQLGVGSRDKCSSKQMYSFTCFGNVLSIRRLAVN